MKKLTILTAGLLIGTLAMPAQKQVLKDAEQAMKDGKAPAEVVTIITPAFSDPETAEMAQTYFIPGKAYFSDYDELFALKQFNKLPEDGNAKMVTDMLEGYTFFMKALPLDTVVDAKGKVKTKYSKDIVNTIRGHHSDFNNAAIAAWELKDYPSAYKAWADYFEVIDNPVLAPKSLPADTILAEIRFNQALAAWQADQLADALAAFEKSKALGYNKKQLYDYAISVASNMQNDAAVYQWATEAEPLYGNEDPNYLGFIINHYLQSKDFDKAFSMIDEAIAKNPSNAQYYVVKGILYDNQDKKAEAKDMFKKALEVDSQNPMALMQYGRSLCEEAYKLSDAAPTSPEESEKYYNEKIVPLFKEAADYLERAWNLDTNNTDALRYLENVYYNLHDEQMYQDVQSRMNK
ncbi:MAG: hypothetical protein NC406_01565 [Bacteroides sp.]|nr:hypothetical protein [Bacteroides sp.]MCM1094995.1 hypothetical protein [Terasakiella sp.]